MTWPDGLARDEHGTPMPTQAQFDKRKLHDGAGIDADGRAWIMTLELGGTTLWKGVTIKTD